MMLTVDLGEYTLQISPIPQDRVRFVLKLGEEVKATVEESASEFARGVWMITGKATKF